MKRHPMWNVYEARQNQATKTGCVSTYYSDEHLFSLICFIAGRDFESKLQPKARRQSQWLWLCAKSEGFYSGEVKFRVACAGDSARFFLGQEKRGRQECHGALEIRTEVEPNVGRPQPPRPKKLRLEVQEAGFEAGVISLKTQLVEFDPRGEKEWQPFLGQAILDITLEV